MAPRKPLEAHFQQFWSQVAKLVPGSLWRLILSSSGARWQNGSQEVSGGSFGAALEPGGRIAPRKPLQVHFEHFWSQVAKLLPGRLWRLILRSSGARWQNGFTQQ